MDVLAWKTTDCLLRENRVGGGGSTLGDGQKGGKRARPLGGLSPAKAEIKKKNRRSRLGPWTPKIKNEKGDERETRKPLKQPASTEDNRQLTPGVQKLKIGNKKGWKKERGTGQGEKGVEHRHKTAMGKKNILRIRKEGNLLGGKGGFVEN